MGLMFLERLSESKKKGSLLKGSSNFPPELGAD